MAVKQIVSKLRIANQGYRLRDKQLVFLLTCWTSMGSARREKLRDRFYRRINRFGKQGLVTVDLKWQGRRSTLLLREGNPGDYAIASEFAQTPYRTPDRTPRSIIDGGANIGIFSVFAANRFPGVPITCYEPDPENFKQLEQNLQANAASSAKPKKLGLWKEAAELSFQRTGAQLGHIGEGDNETIRIQCVAPEIGEDCWLKLDIEGAEFEVLPALLARGQRPRWISMEIHGSDVRRQELIDMLSSNGYRIVDREIGLGHIDEVMFAELDGST